MARGGARPGAGRKALDQPTEPLLTYSLMLRPTDVGYLNQLGRGNLSLGLRRLIETARLHLPPPSTPPVTADLSPGAAPTSMPAQPRGGGLPVPGHENGVAHYG
jgi:hypothetical protein